MPTSPPTPLISDTTPPLFTDGPPTVRVSSCSGSGLKPDLYDTPPPVGERKLSSAVFRESGRVDSAGIGAPLKVGDRVLGFDLVEELGQGAFAKVFLAHQESLARRPVALKVTMRPTREADRLARLQHTHIVPVYSVHTDGPVQMICMPYLGRRTIADLVRAYRADHASREYSARKTAGTRPARSTATADSRSVPAANYPSGRYHRPLDIAAGGDLDPVVGDPIAVLRMIGQLASGLSHAHERGILHLDLKPANVLLADTGEPMLLDFNLSFDATSPNRELIGGTVPYMSVEQLQDLRTRGHGPVDERSDLYSLGVMAFEMLTGTIPFPATFLADIDGLIQARRAGPPPIGKWNPAVSPAVEAIVRKLLAPEPADRYQSANDLRTDIERHLADLPLRYASENSLRERVGKWRRRNPRLPGRVLAAAGFALALTLGGLAYKRTEDKRDLEAATQVAGMRTGLDRLRLDLAIPGEPAARARGISKATELLASYGLSDESDWKQNEIVRRLTQENRSALGGDLGELMLLLAQCRWRDAAGRPDEACREAARTVLQMTALARTCFPPDAVPPAADRLESQARQALGEAVPAAVAAQPSDARGLFLEATDQMAVGLYSSAAIALESTIESQPGHAAAQFCLALCRQQLGQRERCLERYDAARVLLPNDPRPSYYRGIEYGKSAKPHEAEVEYTRALAIDPTYAPAYRNRALARMRMGRLEEAEQDLNDALRHDGPALQLRLLRADVRKWRHDAAGEAADRQAVANMAPKLEGDYLVRGLMRIESDPRGAVADFQAALEMNPRLLPALQNQAHVWEVKLNDQERALALLTRAVQFYPDHALSRCGRAVVLARLGRRTEAHEEIQKVLALSTEAEVYYRAACVYSLTSTKEEKDADKAIKMFREAVAKGYREPAVFASDPDLNPIRAHKDYREIVEAAKSLRRMD